MRRAPAPHSLPVRHLLRQVHLAETLLHRRPGRRTLGTLWPRRPRSPGVLPAGRTAVGSLGHAAASGRPLRLGSRLRGSRGARLLRDLSSWGTPGTRGPGARRGPCVLPDAAAPTRGCAGLPGDGDGGGGSCLRVGVGIGVLPACGWGCGCGSCLRRAGDPEPEPGARSCGAVCHLRDAPARAHPAALPAPPAPRRSAAANHRPSRTQPLSGAPPPPSRPPAPSGGRRCVCRGAGAAAARGGFNPVGAAGLPRPAGFGEGDPEQEAIPGAVNLGLDPVAGDTSLGLGRCPMSPTPTGGDGRGGVLGPLLPSAGARVAQRWNQPPRGRVGAPAGADGRKEGVRMLGFRLDSPSTSP